MYCSVYKTLMEMRERLFQNDNGRGYYWRQTGNAGTNLILFERRDPMA
jgi:hypothetical protein